MNATCLMTIRLSEKSFVFLRLVYSVPAGRRTTSRDVVARSAASRPKQESLRGLTYIVYPEIHEVDLWQV